MTTPSKSRPDLLRRPRKTDELTRSSLGASFSVYRSKLASPSHLPRGEPEYLVSYVGLGPEANEYLPRHDVERKFGTKLLKHFERDWEKSKKESFNPVSFFTEPGVIREC